MIKEFKEFVMRGSVLDLAIGIIIGAAFTAIVKSFVDDILMPPIGMLLGGVDFSELFISLDGTTYSSLAAAQDAGAATINYGLFINAVINFLIVALVLFLIIRQVNRMRAPEKEEAPAAPTTKECPYCRMEVALEASRCPHCTSEL
ncbi:MAG: large conductance mechanosensitive channel protein MscL [Chloroflexota bacterium]|jgi:large conductance mechanosensitive channel